MMIFDRLEIGVFHRVSRGDSLSVVVLKHLAEQVNRFFGNKLLILSRYKFSPGFAWVLTEDIIIVRVKLNIVLLNISKKFICSKNFRNFNKLVIIVFTLEEGFFLKNHTSKHTA
jgi:hypothetical protein